VVAALVELGHLPLGAAQATALAIGGVVLALLFRQGMVERAHAFAVACALAAILSPLCWLANDILLWPLAHVLLAATPPARARRLLWLGAFVLLSLTVTAEGLGRARYFPLLEHARPYAFATLALVVAAAIDLPRSRF
jgi:hypothetical protein